MAAVLANIEQTLPGIIDHSRRFVESRSSTDPIRRATRSGTKQGCHVTGGSDLADALSGLFRNDDIANPINLNAVRLIEGGGSTIPIRPPRSAAAGQRGDRVGGQIKPPDPMISIIGDVYIRSTDSQLYRLIESRMGSCLTGGPIAEDGGTRTCHRGDSTG